MSKGMFSGQLCPQKDFKQHVYWWVELYSCSVGCLTCGVSVVNPTGYWVVPILAASRRAHANEHSPELPLSLCLFLQWAAATSSHSTSTGDPPIPAGNLALNPKKSLLFSPGSWCARDLVLTPKSRVSVSPSPLEFLLSNPTDPQSQIFRGPPLPIALGSELSPPWERFFDITIF